MKITVSRDKDGDGWTLGVLHIDGEFECYTCEDEDRKMEAGGTKVHGKTAIPRGTYQVVVDFSNRFQKNLPHILNVPHFEGIRIHSGNTAADTEGCILVGTNRDIKAGSVLNSRVAFRNLMPKIEEALKHGKVTIEVR